MLALLFSATVFFAPGPPHPHYPNPTLFLHGYHVVNDVKIPDARPVLGRDDTGPYVALRFTAPIDATCALIQLVKDGDGDDAMIFLSTGHIPLSETVQMTFHLAPPDKLDELTDTKGTTEKDYSIQLACEDTSDPKTLIYSTIYHAPF